jgi:hypothetical protein
MDSRRHTGPAGPAYPIGRNGSRGDLRHLRASSLWTKTLSFQASVAHFTDHRS